MNNEFVLVYETYDPISAGLLKAKFDDEGIPYASTGENEIGYPRLALGHTVKFYVHEEYYEVALTLINTDRSSFLNDNFDY